MQAQKVEHRQSAKFFADAGAYAPTIGIIGTVMGLVHVLENLAQPEELGHLIAAAFVATLWGVHLGQRDLAADRQPASSVSASSRSPAWSWPSRASPRSSPAPTPA